MIIMSSKVIPTHLITAIQKIYKGSDHFLVTSRITLLSRWKQQNNTSKSTNESVNKVYLLQEESIRRLYQQRLSKTLSEYPRASTINKEWENIKIAIKKAANEAIGTKK
jgi:hypothetical protein